MEFRKLTIADKDQLDTLISTIEESLDNPEFWLPINEIAREHFFDESWTNFYGLFDGSHLIAAAALFYNEHEYGESLSKLDIPSDTVAEIGRAMVHPDYRNSNLLLTITTKLLDIARAKGKEYVLATIHPQNIPSQKSFTRLGMKKQCTYLKSSGFIRDIFIMKL